jgi:putative ABC transport system permease protein
VGLVLLIAVVNVANLMLARATVASARWRCGSALGAGRGRLVRQLLTESVLLAAMGGAAGLALAWGGIELIRAWNPGNLPLIDSVRLDGAALGFTLLVSMLTGVLFGLAPAFESARADLNATIKEGGRSGAASRPADATRAALVVSEIAVSLMLLVGAGLLLRSFANLQRVTGGFSTPPRQILTMLISPGNRKYNDAAPAWPSTMKCCAVPATCREWKRPPVTDSLPPDRQGDADTFGLKGRPWRPERSTPSFPMPMGSGLLPALGIPLIKGRYFTDPRQSGFGAGGDRQRGLCAPLLAEPGSHRQAHQAERAGARKQVDGNRRCSRQCQIPGVNGRHGPGLLPALRPKLWSAGVCSWQCAPRGTPAGWRGASPGNSIHRPGRNPGANRHHGAGAGALRLATALRHHAAGRCSRESRCCGRGGNLRADRYSVAQRTHEIGVRMALGAARADVVRMVVRQGASLAAMGIVLGLGGAFGLTRLLQTMLFGIGVTDPWTFLSAPAAILIVVLLATFLPALRSTRISPVVALRYE